MEKFMSKKLTLVFAIAVGVLIANLYYAQPLVAQISKAIGLKPELAGLVVTLTQMGYGLGVLLIVPLGDIIESKKLTLMMIGVTILGVLGLAFTTSLVPYFIAAFATGVGASTVQILVPYAASIVPDEKRGALVGRLMSGLMIGIMLARPASGIVTDMFNWHAIFILSAVLMAFMILLLYKALPIREPQNTEMKYFQLIGSMFTLYTTITILRRRAIYQAFLFGSFCLFWTAAPLYLAGPEFNLSATQIAIFALVGVGGAIVSPYAGIASDKGWVWGATLVAMIASSLSFIISHAFAAGSTFALVAMVIAAILLDAGVIANLVLGQREIFTLPAVYRSRLNGLFIATVFIGGATGSALGAWSFAKGGWKLTTWVGFALPVVALLYFLTEKRAAKVQAPAV